MNILAEQMQEVWISCLQCSVSFKESVHINADYMETSICGKCQLLCERCGEKPSTDINLCQSCDIIMQKNQNILKTIL